MNTENTVLANHSFAKLKPFITYFNGQAGQDFRNFQEILENYFALTNTSNDQKLTILKAQLTGEAKIVYKDLTRGQDNLTYSQAVELLKEYYVTDNLIESYQQMLRGLTQKPNEKPSSFYARIVEVAELAEETDMQLLLSVFKNGLWMPIRKHCRRLGAKTLQEWRTRAEDYWNSDNQESLHEIHMLDDTPGIVDSYIKSNAFSATNSLDNINNSNVNSLANQIAQILTRSNNVNPTRRRRNQVDNPLNYIDNFTEYHPMQEKIDIVIALLKEVQIARNKGREVPELEAYARQIMMELGQEGNYNQDQFNYNQQQYNRYNETNSYIYNNNNNRYNGFNNQRRNFNNNQRFNNNTYPNQRSYYLPEDNQNPNNYRNQNIYTNNNNNQPQNINDNQFNNQTYLSNQQMNNQSNNQSKN